MARQTKRGEEVSATPEPIYKAIVLGDNSSAVFRGLRNAPEECALEIFVYSEEGYEIVRLASLMELATIHDFLGECLIRLQSDIQ